LRSSPECNLYYQGPVPVIKIKWTSITNPCLTFFIVSLAYFNSYLVILHLGPVTPSSNRKILLNHPRLFISGAAGDLDRIPSFKQSVAAPLGCEKDRVGVFPTPPFYSPPLNKHRCLFKNFRDFSEARAYPAVFLNWCFFSRERFFF